MDKNTTTSEETVLKSEYDTLMREHQKVISAFNMLLDEYNSMHVKMLLDKAEQKTQ